MSGADWVLKTWNVNQAILLAFGVTITKGTGQTGMSADGPFLELEQDGKSYDVKKGPDGSVVRFSKNEPVAYLRVHVMQTSEANGVFSAIWNKGLAGDDSDIGTATVTDNRGTTAFASLACWITGPPKLAWGGEPGELVWEICCTKNSRFDGGN